MRIKLEDMYFKNFNKVNLKIGLKMLLFYFF